MFRTKVVVKTKKHVLGSIIFFKKIVLVMWDNNAETGRPQMTTRSVRIVCWIPKAKNNHSEYVLLILFYCNSICSKAPHCYVYMYIFSRKLSEIDGFSM
jgi:hypothetical protein